MAARLGRSRPASAYLIRPKLQSSTAASIDVQLSPVTMDFAGTPTPPSGTLDQQLSPVTMTFAGTAAGSGTFGMTLSPVTVDAAATVNPIGDFGLVLGGVTQSFVMETTPKGENVITVEEDSRAFLVTDEDPGLIPITRAEVTKPVGPRNGSFSMTLSPVTQSLTGGSPVSGSFATTLSNVTMSGYALGDGSDHATIDVTLSPVTMSSSVTNNAVYVADYATPQLAANAATGGKWLIFPSSATYEVEDLQIPANCYVVGNGSTLKFSNGVVSSSVDTGQILSITGSGITIDNLTFDANSVNQTAWSQQMHAVKALGVYSNTVVKNCTFVNLIGDGVYINLGPGGGTTGSGFEVYNCSFTAANDNRNGVSCVTGDSIWVHGCTFTNLTRPDMPGAIDLEPNSTSETLSNVTIENNTITRARLNGASDKRYGIIIANNSGQVVTNAVIQNNNISGIGCDSGILAIGVNGGPFSTSSITITNNTIHDVGYIGVELDYWIGAAVTNNTISNTSYGIYNYLACLTSSTGNTFSGITGTNIQQDTPHCS